MEKKYIPNQVENSIYSMWESGGYFSPNNKNTNDDKEPFCIILPPPNANADLHLGHAMYVVEDIMVRYRRMNGHKTLWLPGADHAGFETQFVFEKHLQKKGKSRFDYKRDVLYKKIWDFVHNNRDNMTDQLKQIGFSLDWSRFIFTLDKKIVKIVHSTFKKLYDDGLIYRGKRLVNYCTKCGTSFSDLEVLHVERNDPLYYMKYGPFTLATVRPETKFGDTAVAVNPKDARYKKWIGKKITVKSLIADIHLSVIADDAIDMKFGTGVAKVTPAHDMVDFEIGKRHKLDMKQVIGFDGKLTKIAGKYAGLYVTKGRKQVVEDLQKHGLIDRVDNKYSHTISTCYKCGTTLEPLPLSQWFLQVKKLAKKAKTAIKKGEITFIPKRYKKQTTEWLTDFHDWNISRQIVWGIQIPAWKCTDCSETTKNNDSDNWIITDGKIPKLCPKCKGSNLQQDSDTFDTWFSSGQWPFATLKVTGNKTDFNTFYPTSVMETGYDILPMWVCRMIMLGLYETDSVPFKTVYLHGMVRDNKGQKMSKSKGNVINPIDMIKTYGADALRMALIYGTKTGNDLSFSEEKIKGMRNFANKLWNIARFIKLNIDAAKSSGKTITLYDQAKHASLQNAYDKRIITETNMLIANVTKDMDEYRYSDASQKIYEFTWHKIADVHLEKNKERFKNQDEQAIVVLLHVFTEILKLLHPFMPFISEKLWSLLPQKNNDPLIISPWPGEKD